jgi:hypothetical protein
MRLRAEVGALREQARKLNAATAQTPSPRTTAKTNPEPEGKEFISAEDSSFDMAYTDGAWRPVLSLRWLDRKNSSSFATSPVFGPQIDLEP